MKASPSGRITDFREKPKDPQLLEAMRVPEDTFTRFRMEAEGRTHLASMGVYVFNRSVLQELLEDTAFEDFGKEVIPFAIHKKKVYSYFFKGYWEDIGTIRSFFQAHLDMTRIRPKFQLFDEARPIFTRARFLPGSRILDSEIHRSIICEGSIINRARISDSIIGIRSHIGKDTSLEKTVFMGANRFEVNSDGKSSRKSSVPGIGIGDNCEIRNAIIDRNARIGHNVKLINTGNIKHFQCEDCHIIDEVIVIPKNTVIPDGTVI
jgi:glucose-1-phosphate adenylyltransferase